MRRSGEHAARGQAPESFLDAEGKPTLHLVSNPRHAQDKLSLVEDSTGLLVDNADARVTALGIGDWAAPWPKHYEAAGTAG